MAAGLFVFALAVFGARTIGRAAPETIAAAGALFAILTGTTLGLSVARWREQVRLARTPSLLAVLAVPAVLTGFIAVYSAVAGVSVVHRVAAFGAYLALPALIVATRGGVSPSPVRVLIAAVSLWLPIEFDVLPSLRLPEPNGFRATPLVALTNGLYLFLVARPVRRIGYTFALTRRDAGIAVVATLLFAFIGLPIGLATGFLQWHPRMDWITIGVAPVAIYLATAVPEEFLFRGLIQNALEQLSGRAGLPLASVIFGLAHLPDLRYVVLATLAGAAYGWVYARTRRITAAAITHALVDWIWVLLLRA